VQPVDQQWNFGGYAARERRRAVKSSLRAVIDVLQLGRKRNVRSTSAQSRADNACQTRSV